MPSGISQSIANPVALVQRPTATPRERESAAVAETQNAQMALAAGGNDLIRAPDPGTDAQAADNGLENNHGHPGSTPGSLPDAQEPPLQMAIDQGLGGNLDITA